MAIPETEPVKNHYGNNSATSFDFDFYIEKSSQLKVQHTDLNGLLTTLKENVDYSIHEIGNENGSYITFPISGSTYDILKWDTVNDKKELLTISLNIPLKQEFEFDISGDLDKHQLEKAFDYQMRVDQILNRKINRAVLVPEGSKLTPTELIETLQNSKAEAVQAASDAAMSATNAQNSANLSKEQSDIASDKLNAINQKMEEFSDNYNFATNDIQNKHSDAILDIQNNLQTAEDTIIAGRMEAIQAITKNKNNSISDITTAGAEQVTNIKQTGFYMQGDKLYYIDSNGETKEFKSGSSGLEVCDIGKALYIDETKGLRRRLNGQIVDANANTQGFIDKLLKIKETNPDYFTDEDTWQSEKTMNVDGCVYKFVLNYSGDNVVSVRLPKYPDYVEVNAGGTLPVVGNGMTLGLSDGINNAGLGQTTTSGTTKLYPFNNAYGSILPKTADGSSPFATHAHIGITTDPTKSGIETTLKQTKLKLYYFIQIATGVETEVNIKDTLKLNNPFTFGMNMYFKGEMDNVSWLKSNGQQNAKADYPNFYNWALINANAGKDGFKLSTASDITDYDFVVNTTDETFRLPLKNGQEGVFANGVKGNGITLGLTDGTTNYGVGIDFTDRTGYFLKTTSQYGQPVATTANNSTGVAKILAGLTTDSSKSGMVVDTTVPTGYNLYYYVGVTVQNEGLINAGRFAEKLVNCLDKASASDKALSVMWSAPDFSTKTAKNNNTDYTAEYTGWLEIKTDDYNTITYLTINGDRRNINGVSDNHLNNTYTWMLLPKGTTYKIEFGRIFSAETNYMNFYKCIGEV